MTGWLALWQWPEMQDTAIEEALLTRYSLPLVVHRQQNASIIQTLRAGHISIL
jgi:hypothetical protein